MTPPDPNAKQPNAEEEEEADEYPRWAEAMRAVENGECGAQLEISDPELRRSMIRNFAAAILAAEARAFEEAARAVCGDCAVVGEKFTGLVIKAAELSHDKWHHLWSDGQGGGVWRRCDAGPIHRLAAAIRAAGKQAGEQG